MYTNFEDLTKARDEAIQTNNAVMSSVYEGARKLVELNVQTARSSFEQSTDTFRNLLGVHDPKAAAETTNAAANRAAKLQDGAAVDYIRQVIAISNETAGEIQSLIEKQVASNQKNVLATLDALSRNAPAGAHGYLDLVKQGVNQANAAYTQVSNQTRQFADIVEANVVGATKAAASTRRRATAAATSN